MRIEKDPIGEVELPDDAVYGINTYRARDNFTKSGETINPYLIKAYFLVKQAACQTNYKAGLLLKQKFEYIEEAIDNLVDETEECIQGKCNSIYEKIIVDPYQGGAGTSLNLNINEVIANTALDLMGKKYGEYDYLHPFDHVNLSQSSNDTFQSALRIAAIYLINELIVSMSLLTESLKEKEKEFKGVLKLGRTQFQDAVPVTLGQEFGAYARAIERGKDRLTKSIELLYPLNMGGTAIGNSITATREYVKNINTLLKKIVKLPVCKGENMIDITQNGDVFTELHGIITSSAVSTIKICNDLRFLSSGPRGGIGEINLPVLQAGSSMMPGKVNPVMLENAIQISELVKGNNLVIQNAVGNGNLELNSFLPLIAHTFLKSISLLRDSNLNLTKNCISGITANEDRCREHLLNSSAVAASLIPKFGYETIQEISSYAEANKMTFIKALLQSKLVKEEELFMIISNEMGLDLE